MLRDYQRWRKLEQATLAYGYGLSVTPLQLVRAMAAIADGGRLRQPSFILDSDNPVQNIMDPALAEQLTAMLETVTESGRHRDARGNRRLSRRGQDRDVA